MCEVDEHLKRCAAGPDQERDRLIFWLYFRQGMTLQEIASLPAIGLAAKGVGSVIERLKHSIRDQILGIGPDSTEDHAATCKSIFPEKQIRSRSRVI